METELKILKKIFEEKGKTHIKSISDYLGFGRDYLRFICQRLVEKDLLKSVQRDWFELSKKGERELKLRGLIELKKKRLRPTRRPLTHLPALKLEDFSKKTKSSPRIKLTANFGSLKEKKLKLGRGIEKAASFLERLKEG